MLHFLAAVNNSTKIESSFYFLGGLLFLLVSNKFFFIQASSCKSHRHCWVYTHMRVQLKIYAFTLLQWQRDLSSTPKVFFPSASSYFIDWFDFCFFPCHAQKVSNSHGFTRHLKVRLQHSHLWVRLIWQVGQKDILLYLPNLANKSATTKVSLLKHTFFHIIQPKEININGGHFSQMYIPYILVDRKVNRKWASISIRPSSHKK